MQLTSPSASSSRRRSASRLGARIALVAAVGLVASCGSSTPSASSTGGPPSAGPATGSPAATATATAGASPSAVVPPAPTPTAASGWVDAGTMTVGRVAPETVRLADGRVLAVGTLWAVNEADALTTDLYDPATGTWAAGPGLPKLRTDAVLVALTDGRALLAGGLNDQSQSYSSAYVFDPSAMTWTKVGLMATARSRASAALLADGRVLVAGGYFSKGGTADDGGVALAAYRAPGTGAGAGGTADDVEPEPIGPAMATAELFDPASGAWSKTGPMAFARFGSPMATLADGRVLIVGTASARCCGVEVVERAYDTAELYDPGTGTWSSAGTLPAIDREALQKLGKSGANKIPEAAPEPEGGARLIALADGGALLVNDFRSWKHQGDLDRSFRFDAATKTWSEVGRTYVAVGEPGPIELVTPDAPNLGLWTLAPLPDGSVFALNRDTGAAATLDPLAGTLGELPAPPTKRTLPALVALADGSALVVGGSDDDAPLTSADRYVP